jgi:hypothetical protein
MYVTAGKMSQPATRAYLLTTYPRLSDVHECCDVSAHVNLHINSCDRSLISLRLEPRPSECRCRGGVYRALCVIAGHNCGQCLTKCLLTNECFVLWICCVLLFIVWLHVLWVSLKLNLQLTLSIFVELTGLRCLSELHVVDCISYQLLGYATNLFFCMFWWLIFLHLFVSL